MIFQQFFWNFGKSTPLVNTLATPTRPLPSISILNTHIFSLLLPRFKLWPKDLGLSLVTTGPSSLLLIYIHNKYVKVHY